MKELEGATLTTPPNRCYAIDVSAEPNDFVKVTYHCHVDEKTLNELERLRNLPRYCPNCGSQSYKTISKG